MQLEVNIATLQEAVGQVVYGRVSLGICNSTREQGVEDERCIIGGCPHPYNAIQ